MELLTDPHHDGSPLYVDEVWTRERAVWPRELAVLAPRNGSSGPASGQLWPHETAVVAPRTGT